MPWRNSGMIRRGGSWCRMVPSFCPPSVSVLALLPTIRVPAPILKLFGGGSCRYGESKLTRVRLQRQDTPVRHRSIPSHDAIPKARPAPPLPSRALSQLALHNYAAPVARLWRVRILSLGHRVPNAGHHVVSGAVAVGDDAGKPGLAGTVAQNDADPGSIFTSSQLGLRGCVPDRDPRVAVRSAPSVGGA